MRKRVDLLKGDFVILSVEGEGATIRVEIPLGSMANTLQKASGGGR